MTVGNLAAFVWFLSLSHREAIANPTDFFNVVTAFTPLHRLVLVGMGLTALTYMLQHGAAATQRLLAAAIISTAILVGLLLLGSLSAAHFLSATVHLLFAVTGGLFVFGFVCESAFSLFVRKPTQIHIRGKGQISYGRAKAQIARLCQDDLQGLTFGSMSVPFRLETGHFLLTGSPGAGKTTFVKITLCSMVERIQSLLYPKSPRGDFGSKTGTLPTAQKNCPGCS